MLWGFVRQQLLCRVPVLIFRNIFKYVGCWETADVTSVHFQLQERHADSLIQNQHYQVKLLHRD